MRADNNLLRGSDAADDGRRQHLQQAHPLLKYQ